MPATTSELSDIRSPRCNAPTMTSMDHISLCLKLDAQLGEGLHWDASHHQLWGVDIHGRQVWRWNLQSSSWQSWQLAERVGWVLPEAGGDRLLFGLQQGFALAQRDDPEQWQWLHRLFVGQAALRLNDAKADATGAVWAGSLNNDDESRSDGCLYRLDRSGQVTLADSGYTVANGPAISPDGALLLHTDSGRRTIYAFTLDAKAGTVADKRVWKVFTPEEGYPDGMCFDAEGCVWVAHWGAGCISRFTLDGALLRRIALPVTQVTNVCFAGPGLDRLFVSSARVGLDSNDLAGQPLAGALFEVLHPDTKGLPGLPCGPFNL
ncbi:SMP-30/gluconolactonase/LRE family protein [Lacisediminimonas profundi]|uniref:SMP-30/gluconolactonase/LRE family protein n=1 Tax=Lacisediminimonas profundi TaxID=2603856 RepID=UPI0019D658C6|nr:SMP-30/gluconolactonase/LRE family protein [Lacisediminimonas profundi]